MTVETAVAVKDLLQQIEGLKLFIIILIVAIPFVVVVTGLFRQRNENKITNAFVETMTSVTDDNKRELARAREVTDKQKEVIDRLIKDLVPGVKMTEEDTKRIIQDIENVDEGISQGLVAALDSNNIIHKVDKTTVEIDAKVDALAEKIETLPNNILEVVRPFIQELKNVANEFHILTTALVEKHIVDETRLREDINKLNTRFDELCADIERKLKDDGQ